MTRASTTRRVHHILQFDDTRHVAQRIRRRRPTATTSMNHLSTTVLPRSSHVLSSESVPVHPSLPPLACRPLTPFTPSLRHTLQPFSDITCASCGAMHWIEERASNTSKRNLLFSTCCERGGISLPPLLEPPEPLYSLLHDATPGNSGSNFSVYTDDNL